ncbi:MAG: hypothetical protein ABSF26_25875 [Thermoguttaceae bacterium]|jgi:hypothetical protein
MAAGSHSGASNVIWQAGRPCAVARNPETLPSWQNWHAVCATWPARSNQVGMHASQPIMAPL